MPTNDHFFRVTAYIQLEASFAVLQLNNGKKPVEDEQQLRLSYYYACTCKKAGMARSIFSFVRSRSGHANNNS